MEGIYYFGEHLRWNLGWNNPNQAGVFIAMLIPWLWVAGRCGAGTSGKAVFGCWLLLAAELGLWFLLCKTYSRGALVAAVLAGGAFALVGGIRNWKRPGCYLPVTRIAGVAILLFVTGFLARIDPRFVSHDASAGNRLVLWEGGLRMIAASPWRGWGAGQSGIGFMHWFQPLGSKQEYAGMVNSYLHVGVEYGLPVLMIGMMIALAVVIAGFATGAWRCPWSEACWHGDGSLLPDRHFQRAAGASVLVFLIANVFSTLWIFGNLWFLPGVAGVAIICLGFRTHGRRFIGVAGTALSISSFLSGIVCLGLHVAGKRISGDAMTALSPNGDIAVWNSNGKPRQNVILYPDRSVLGRDWGKEVRRLVASPAYQDGRIIVPADGCSTPDCGTPGVNPEYVMACGGHSARGFAALSRYPKSHLILIHPLGKPVAPAGLAGKVSVILPMLDTNGGGRRWRAECKRRGWKCLTSPGVAQDVRLVWPDVLNDFSNHAAADQDL